MRVPGRLGVEDREAAAQRWAISYADLLTLLFAFFVVMYAVSIADRDRLGPILSHVRSALVTGAPGPLPIDAGTTGAVRMPMPDASRSRLERMKRDIVKQLASQDSIAARATRARMSGRGLVVSLRGAAFYAEGSEALTEEGRGVLETIASAIRGHAGLVRVEGEGGDVRPTGPRAADPWQLGAARAVAVVRVLEESFRLTPGQLSAVALAGSREAAGVELVVLSERGARREVDGSTLRRVLDRLGPAPEFTGTSGGDR